MLDLELADDFERTRSARLDRIGRLVIGGKENDRRETFAAVEILEPVETGAPFPRVIEQHDAVSLTQESRSQRPAYTRVVTHDFGVGPVAGNVVTKQRAVARIVVYQHQTHIEQLTTRKIV